MPKLNQFQRSFLKSLLTKMLFFPAVWFFIWAIYPLAWEANRQLTFYLMLSLFNWLCFIFYLVGAVLVDLLINDSVFRQKVRSLKLERGKSVQKSPKPSQKKEGKESPERLPLF